MKYLLMTLLTALSTIFGCQRPRDYRNVDVDAFESIIAKSSTVLLDVRTAEEYAAGHIANALNIDVQQSSFESLSLERLPRRKTIAVYCRSGKRSRSAAEILVKNGFKVVNLDDGFNGWSGAGKPVAKD